LACASVVVGAADGTLLAYAVFVDGKNRAMVRSNWRMTHTLTGKTIRPVFILLLGFLLIRNKPYH
jgi:hypothetical protein